MHPFIKSAVAALCLSAAAVQAVPISGQGTWETTLQARDMDGDGVTDAYYDTALNITWLANANANGEGMKSWQDAMAWASSLTLGGFDDWRLPTITDVGNDGCNYINGGGGADCGFKPDPTSSELAYLYYITLGNLGASIPDGAPGDGDWGLHNTGYFDDMHNNVYWSSTEFVQTPGNAWAFSFYFGYQGDYAQDYNLARAWAVRDGDVAAAAPVPEPGTYALMLAGLAAVPMLKRRRQAKQD